MLLRKLEMQGFKSFADKTEFVFDPGVTGIVGPNGCGKSNVVDAIKWALGEMSAKSLRGEELADVIFNGAEGRAALGFAEVSLTFSNEDGRLPIEYSEVTVTRRLFRSGESEYLLNRQPCRLRDIRELFMDTGIGSDGYSIIEQGKIDLLLLSSPKERRSIFEEAAGISKYKAKRRETQTKLERVTQDLLRAGDVVKELTSQIRSLKIQSGRAERYQKASQEYREKKTQLSLHCYRDQVGQGKDRVERLASLRTRRAALAAEAAAVEAGIVEAEERAQALEEEWNRAQEALHEAEGQARETRERVAGDRRILAELTESGERRKQDAALLRERAVEARRKHAEGEERLREVLRELERSSRELEERTSTWQEVCRGVQELAERLNVKKGESLEAVRKRSSYQNQVLSIESEHRRLESSKGQVERREREIATEVGRLDQEESELTTARQALEADQSAALAAHRQNDEALRGLKHRVEALQKEVSRLRELEGRKGSRQELLHDLEGQREGLGAGVKAVLEAVRASDGSVTGILGIVADVLEVDSERVPVVEAILNGRSQCLLAKTREDAVRVLEFVRARKLGRVQVLPLEQVAAAAKREETRVRRGSAAADGGGVVGVGDGAAALCDGADDEEPAVGANAPERPANAALPAEAAPAAAPPAPAAGSEEPPALGRRPDLAPDHAAAPMLERALFGGVPLASLTSLGTSPGMGGFGFLAALFGDHPLRTGVPAAPLVRAESAPPLEISTPGRAPQVELIGGTGAEGAGVAAVVPTQASIVESALTPTLSRYAGEGDGADLHATQDAREAPDTGGGDGAETSVAPDAAAVALAVQANDAAMQLAAAAPAVPSSVVGDGAPMPGPTVDGSAPELRILSDAGSAGPAPDQAPLEDVPAQEPRRESSEATEPSRPVRAEAPTVCSQSPVGATESAPPEPALLLMLDAPAPPCDEEPARYAPEPPAVPIAEAPIAEAP
ncbi:MAG: AAA family ATPase, partial [Planctomycetes bacterium]|nr:AAA family ATPase [Planctomycetota bacterium]